MSRNQLFFIGLPAFSPFRTEKLLVTLRADLPALKSIGAEWIYVLQTSPTKLEENDTNRICELLQGRLSHPLELFNASTLYSGTPAANTLVLQVLPRIGTISPWSSKASDIFRLSSLPDIARVERGIRFSLHFFDAAPSKLPESAVPHLSDRMTQVILTGPNELSSYFGTSIPGSLGVVPVLQEGRSALVKANRNLDLALSDAEINYLYETFISLKRDPTDTELMMFAQANSEHCRHKIFGGPWIVDDEAQALSLFDMIKNTYRQSPTSVLSAYKDNAAIIAGHTAKFLFALPNTNEYEVVEESAPFAIKVETHNHPTAVSPFPGAATGSGGEIRDEAACGRGAKAKAGITGFMVSHLRIPEHQLPWEESDYGHPSRIASPLQIMTEGPLGAAAFNNEFGRPAIGGFFRTFEGKDSRGQHRGYLKPIMLAGGLGSIRPHHVKKLSPPPGSLLLVLGGPAFAIGLGGGSASSLTSGQGSEELDFASVQRDNPEMQRRCTEVIDACRALGEGNPILSIHDVGAGGLSNALPEIVNDAGLGAIINLRAIPQGEPGLSPRELWCNESQERFVLAIKGESLETFADLCERERCPFAVVGTATAEPIFTLQDPLHRNNPVDLPLAVLFDAVPRPVRTATRASLPPTSSSTPDQPEVPSISEALYRVLKHPTVADKTFLITIGDRSVGGLVARDQMVGPWQTPVSDVGVTATGFFDYVGEAIALGERTPVALYNSPAAARLAVGEAITNIAAAKISDLSDIKLSANWMVSAGDPIEEGVLFDTVATVGLELCPALGICIPVGKDSMSMQTSWNHGSEGKHGSERKQVRAPLSLIVTAFAPVTDIRKTLTPQLTLTGEPTDLFLISPTATKRLGGSILEQVYSNKDRQLGRGEAPDLEEPSRLKALFDIVQSLNSDESILAYHDRSDGGLIVTLCEMAFAARCGLDISLQASITDPISFLFAEELGVVVQTPRALRDEIVELLSAKGLADSHWLLGSINSKSDRINIIHKNASGEEKTILSESRPELQRVWSSTSKAMQQLRDNPSCIDEWWQRYAALDEPRLKARLTFNSEENISAPYIKRGLRPRVAILRDQGVNGHIEMAAAFYASGFTAVDIHMQDLISGRHSLSNFSGLAACGGFSFGDVLGAGRGWAATILHNDKLKEIFGEFFLRPDTFSLGVCNGCQMMANLKPLIPGAEAWPEFVRNTVEQFEARLSLVEILPSPSLFFAGMEGSSIPVVVSHGEGRAAFKPPTGAESALKGSLVPMRFIEAPGIVATSYPTNPNGSPHGITALTSADGRATIMMPHPERVFRTVQLSWAPQDWGEFSPWIRIFRNARTWVG